MGRRTVLSDWFSLLFMDTPATYVAGRIADAEEHLATAMERFNMKLPDAARFGYQQHLKNNPRRYRVRFDRYNSGRKQTKETTMNEHEHTPARPLNRDPRERNIERMVDLYTAFREKHGLPSESADELLCDPTLPVEQLEWLERFCWLWDDYTTY